MNSMERKELQQDWKKFVALVVVMGLTVLVIIFFKNYKAAQKLTEISTMNVALKDSLKTWKDKEGNYKASITLLESENSEYFTNWATSDRTVIKLQELVKKYEDKIKNKGSVTIIETEANINIVAPTKIDGITKVNDTIYANYKSDFNIKGWVWGTVSASKDSTIIGMKFKEEIDVIIGTEKTGFLGLGKGKPFAEVTLHNPFNTVTTLKAYSNKPAPAKRFGIGPVAAYGVGPGFTPGIFVGIGVNWSIIKL
jgi:hypothetical protein